MIIQTYNFSISVLRRQLKQVEVVSTTHLHHQLTLPRVQITVHLARLTHQPHRHILRLFQLLTVQVVHSIGQFRFPEHKYIFF